MMKMMMMMRHTYWPTNNKCNDVTTTTKRLDTLTLYVTILVCLPVASLLNCNRCGFIMFYVSCLLLSFPFYSNCSRRFDTSDYDVIINVCARTHTLIEFTLTWNVAEILREVAVSWQLFTPVAPIGNRLLRWNKGSQAQRIIDGSTRQKYIVH